MPAAADHYDDGGENAIYQDAWRIADPGAANPVAVARTLYQASAWLMHERGDTAAIRNHPALRLIAAQLASLYNVDSDGGDSEGATFIGEVERHVNELRSKQIYQERYPS